MLRSSPLPRKRSDRTVSGKGERNLLGEGIVEATKEVILIEPLVVIGKDVLFLLFLDHTLAEQVGLVVLLGLECI